LAVFRKELTMNPYNMPYYTPSMGSPPPGGLTESPALYGYPQPGLGMSDDAKFWLFFGKIAGMVVIPGITGAVFGYKVAGVLGTVAGAGAGTALGVGLLKLWADSGPKKTKPR
jgi:hypothetical protein